MRVRFNRRSDDPASTQGALRGLLDSTRLAEGLQRMRERAQRSALVSLGQRHEERHKSLERLSFADEAIRPGFQRRRLILRVHRKHDHGQTFPSLLYALSGLDPPQAGHARIHEDNIRPVDLDPLTGLLSVAGLQDLGDMRRGSQQGFQTLTRTWLVVDNQNSQPTGGGYT